MRIVTAVLIAGIMIGAAAAQGARAIQPVAIEASIAPALVL